MNPVFAHLIRARNRCFVARSLFLWHQIIGETCGAVPLLRQLSGTIVALPLGADVMTHHLPINACPDGFDIQAKALPNADVLCAYVPVSGLRLEMTIQNKARRVRLLDETGAVYHRQGHERFMFRYRLDPAVLQAQDLMFLQVTREDTGTLSPLPPLRAWIEIDRDGERRLVEPMETSAAVLVPGEAIRLSSFGPDAMAVERVAEGVRSIHLYIEITGESFDVEMIGETLLS